MYRQKSYFINIDIRDGDKEETYHVKIFVKIFFKINLHRIDSSFHTYIYLGSKQWILKYPSKHSTVGNNRDRRRLADNKLIGTTPAGGTTSRKNMSARGECGAKVRRGYGMVSAKPT